MIIACGIGSTRCHAYTRSLCYLGDCDPASSPYSLTYCFRCIFMIVLMTRVVYRVGLSIVGVWRHHSCLAIHLV